MSCTIVLVFCFRTIVAVAGEDFSVIASDTRLSEGFSIHSRDQSKSYQLTKSTVLGACGFHGDVLTLTKLLKARLKVNIGEKSDGAAYKRPFFLKSQI